MAKRSFALAAILTLILFILGGCRMFRNNPQGSPAPTASAVPYMQPSAAVPSAASSSIASVPAGKTASQDTAGAVRKLPEEATAASGQ